MIWLKFLKSINDINVEYHSWILLSMNNYTGGKKKYLYVKVCIETLDNGFFSPCRRPMQFNFVWT